MMTDSAGSARRASLAGMVIAFACPVLAACQSHANGPPPGNIVVDAAAPTVAIDRDQLGTNLAIWYDVTTATLPGEVAQLGAHILRWPGGSGADSYHWQHQTQCAKSGDKYQSGSAWNPNSTFDNFMSHVAVPGDYDVAVTVDYGSNPACDAGADPTEAAAWVAHARQKGWGSRVRYWSIGNEEFGDWELDLHPSPHDPLAYAQAMSGPNGYYALMKAADPQARVGVIVAGNSGNTWDATVLAHAPYDFVEVHYYAQQPGKESDSYLTQPDGAPADFVAYIDRVRSELTAAGKPNIPIMVGELNSVAYNPGRQSVSIVSALYAAEVLLDGIQSGLAADTWWFGDGDEEKCGNNVSSDLYGFQNWGSYDLVFGDSASEYNNCTSSSAGPIVPEGTPSPSGQAFRLVSEFAHPGEHLLTAASGSSDVLAYAATQGGGYALLLVSLNSAAASQMAVSLNGAQGAAQSAVKGARYHATDEIYGKAQYEPSRGNVWPGPARGDLGTVGPQFRVAVPPWSVMLVRLQPQ
jgi:hypothetical protein